MITIMIIINNIYIYHYIYIIYIVLFKFIEIFWKDKESRYLHHEDCST